MKSLSWDQQLGLALPRKRAASQSNQTNNPSKNEVGAGCKSPHPRLSEEPGKVFFLDILFHRMSVIAMLRQQPKPTRPTASRPKRGFGNWPTVIAVFEI
jgi:hypothetical protein